jgi:hypothetical protein
MVYIFFFAESEREQLGKLKVDQAVVVRGRCDRPSVAAGAREPGRRDYIEIELHGCKLAGDN